MMPVQPPHDCINREISENPAILAKTQAKCAASEWPQSYYEHPVVLRSPGEVVVPLALYMDAINLTRTKESSVCSCIGR